jgi:hypothetical protein
MLPAATSLLPIFAAQSNISLMSNFFSNIRESKHSGYAAGWPRIQVADQDPPGGIHRISLHSHFYVIQQTIYFIYFQIVKLRRIEPNRTQVEQYNIYENCLRISSDGLFEFGHH